MRNFLPLSIALLQGILVQGAAIDDCLKAAGVPVDTKGSSGWTNDAQPFNTRLPYTPVAIAAPTKIEHIVAAVSCAASSGVKVTPRGGGHSYASFGLGGENGHLIVALEQMNKVTVDTKTNIAAVGAGSRLGHVFTQLYSQNRRAISHGTCVGVGVAGHTLHGGFGFSSHTRGLALDWLQSATVVLANATVVNASATENSDLFWALRGAGSSFGIVSTFYFNTFEAPSQVTSFQANLNWGSADNLAKGWMAIQNYMKGDMPKEMNFRVFGMGQTAQLQGLYHGSSSALQSAISGLMSSLGTSLTQVSQADWKGGFTAYANGETLDAIRMPHTENFYSKSLVTGELTLDTMKAVGQYWLSTARSNSRQWYIIIDAYGGKNSYVNAVAQNSTSYAYHDKMFLFEFYDRVNSGSYPSNGFSFLDNWVNSFTKNLKDTEWGMYINYADPTMNRTTAQSLYYRQSLPRLQQIKGAVDPKDLFYYPQGIQPKV